MRRAALMNTDDEESDGEAESEDASSDSEPEEDLQAKIDACSDDEAKEELREAQLRKMMEDSQARIAAHLAFHVRCIDYALASTRLPCRHRQYSDPTK